MLTRGVALLIALAFPLAAAAQNESKLIDDYKTLAGSETNSKSLVTGLRDGKQVTLTDGGTTATFTPTTGKMGNGSVNNALLLAEESLRQKGISSPTPEQLKTAVTGILDQRAQHKGWGEIAHSMGVQLGDLRRNERAQVAGRAERAEKPAKPEKPERPERPERPEHAARGK